MFCSSCGTFVQDGNLMCPNCGSEMPIEDTPVNATENSYYTSTDSYTPNYNYGMAPEKDNKKLIIATIIGVVALILTAVFCSFLLKNSTSKINGTYECSTDFEGVSYTFQIIISDDEFEYRLKEPMDLFVYDGTIDTVGNTIQFKPEDDESFSGRYNKNKKTLTFETEMGTLTYKKVS